MAWKSWSPRLADRNSFCPRCALAVTVPPPAVDAKVMTSSMLETTKCLRDTDVAAKQSPIETAIRLFGHDFMPLLLMKEFLVSARGNYMRDRKDVTAR